MAKPSRASRSSRMLARPARPVRPVRESGLPPANPEPVVRAQRQAATAQRAFATDHAFVISELKRIFIMTAGIIALMVVLYLIIG